MGFYPIANYWVKACSCHKFFCQGNIKKEFWGTFSKDFFTDATEMYQCIKEYSLFWWVFSCLNLKLETMATMKETARLLKGWLFPKDVLSPSINQFWGQQASSSGLVKKHYKYFLIILEKFLRVFFYYSHSSLVI